MAIKVTWPDIIKLLQQGEGPNVEFLPKIKNSNDLTKVVVGFANAQGGIVVAGLDDKNGHLIGVDHDKDWALNICKTECEPAVSVQVGDMLRNEKRIIVLQVKEGVNKPYHTVDGTVLTREGVETRQASAEEQKQLNPWGVGGINPRQKKALQFISEQGSISNMQYRELCEVSHKTAHIELIDLVEKGVLIVEGQGRSTAYVLVKKEEASYSTPETIQAEQEQAFPTNGQLFSFEEYDSAEEKAELPKVARPKQVKPVKKTKKVQLIEAEPAEAPEPSVDSGVDKLNTAPIIEKAEEVGEKEESFAEE